MKKDGLIPDSGTYILLISVKKKIKTKKWEVGPGYYLYVGRAKRGLKKRVGRHLKRKKRKRWHIDFITSSPSSKVENIIYLPDPEYECKIANLLAKYFNPLARFGCSDCKCSSHLFQVSI